MAWGIQTWVAGSAANASPTIIDNVIRLNAWDNDAGWNTPLGSAFAPLHQPLPAARGMLDDETAGTLGLGYLASAPSAAGGRRNIELYRSKAYQSVLHISYQQTTPRIWGSQTLPPIGARGSQELQPVWSQRDLIQKKFWATTTQDGLKTMHPSFMPVGYYGDEVCRVLSEVQRHFLEPVVDGGFTWQLWTVQEVQQAFMLRLQRFLLETGLLRKETTLSANDGTALLPQDVLEVRRVQWRYADYRKKPRGLTRIDTKQADQAYMRWDETLGEAEPNSYVEEPSAESMELQACPKPDDNGSLGVRYVPFSTVNFETCGRLPIPRMFTWAVKWGVIADLLKKEGEANDPVRAQAAEEIYSMGVSLAKVLLGTEV